MSDRDLHDTRRALDSLADVQKALHGFTSVSEIVARMERDRREAMQPLASRMAGIADIQGTRTAGLALSAAQAFTDGAAVSQAVQNLVDSKSKMVSISELTRPFLERPVVDLHGIVGNSSGLRTVLDAAVGNPLQDNVQWKPILTRFAQEPFQDVFSRQSADLARVVSAAARPAAFSAVIEALASLRRLPVIDSNIFKVRSPTSPFVDLPDLDLPFGPEDLEEGATEAETDLSQDDGTAVTAPGSEFVPHAEFETLQEEVARLNRSFARLNRPLYVQWTEKLVLTLLSGFILKVVWTHTAAGDVAELVVDQIVVTIEGVVYMLPFIP